MANAFYDLGIERFLKALIAFNSDTIKASLHTASYVRNTSTHEFFSDLSNQVGSSVALSSKTTTAGKAYAGNTTFTAVAGGSTVTQVVLYKDTGVAGTSPLICNLDTGNGLPFSTNGGDIVIVWDSGTNGIFLLAPWLVPLIGSLAALHHWLGQSGARLGHWLSKALPGKKTRLIGLPLPRLGF